jgi:hypothetical protein
MKSLLCFRKYFRKILSLLDDSNELSEETKKLIKIAEQEVKDGKTHSLEKVRGEFNL